MLSAFTSKTAQNLQLNAGVLIKSLSDIPNFDGNVSGKTLLGATSGGATFTATPEMRNMFEDIDGARGKYKSGMTIDNWEIKLSVTLKEMTKENFLLALGVGSTSVATNYDKLTPSMEIQDSNYVDNICWLGTINGKEKPIIIELKNVLNTSGINFTAEDKNNGGLEVEFEAHFDLSKPSEVPFNIYFPKGEMLYDVGLSE